jgi:hypothetical protein
MSIDRDAALERVLSEGDEWQSWRALRLDGDDAGAPPTPSYQNDDGSFPGPSGGPSPGATGEGLAHFDILGIAGGEASRRAVAWLEAVRTPAQAWLDRPEEVPGELDTPAGARVWATASVAAGLLAVGADPGHRAIDLLRGEADLEGRFTGGAYPTFAAAAAYWLREGPKTEMAEWALRWVRESPEDWWGPWERASALTFWGAAGIPIENRTVETFLEELLDAAAPAGFDDDLGLTLRTLELWAHLGA